MTDPRRGLGLRGEALAVEELTRCGYTILNRNWRCQAGEIDVIAEHDGWLVFVEVRARRGQAYGTPEESITPHKAQRLVALAWAYVQTRGLEDADWRIDVVALAMAPDGRVLRTNHIEHAVTGVEHV